MPPPFLIGKAPVLANIQRPARVIVYDEDIVEKRELAVSARVTRSQSSSQSMSQLGQQ